MSCSLEGLPKSTFTLGYSLCLSFTAREMAHCHPTGFLHCCNLNITFSICQMSASDYLFTHLSPEALDDRFFPLFRAESHFTVSCSYFQSLLVPLYNFCALICTQKSHQTFPRRGSLWLSEAKCTCCSALTPLKDHRLVVEALAPTTATVVLHGQHWFLFHYWNSKTLLLKGVFLEMQRSCCLFLIRHIQC